MYFKPYGDVVERDLITSIFTCHLNNSNNKSKS